MSKFPIVASHRETGMPVHMYPTKGDLTVRQFKDAKAEVGSGTTHFSHHPHAADRFEELTGVRPEGFEVKYSKVKEWPNREDDGHEHDWEWTNPDDDDDRAIHCGKCGIEGEFDDEDDDG